MGYKSKPIVQSGFELRFLVIDLLLSNHTINGGTIENVFWCFDVNVVVSE